MSLTIGDFARLGGVSARMLRHYDGLGLLRPSRVDESSGYRYYEAAQLARLNRLVALKEVGFSLDEIGRLIDADPSDVHEQLVRRREELARSIESDQRRLVAVDARINLLDDDHPDLAFVEKSLPRVRLMQLTGEVEDAATLGEHIGSIFGRLTGLLAADGSRPRCRRTPGTTAHPRSCVSASATGPHCRIQSPGPRSQICRRSLGQ